MAVSALSPSASRKPSRRRSRVDDQARSHLRATDERLRKARVFVEERRGQPPRRIPGVDLRRLFDLVDEAIDGGFDVWPVVDDESAHRDSSRTHARRDHLAQIIETLARSGHRGDRRCFEPVRQHAGIDLEPTRSCNIAHVHRDHRRNADLEDLDREVEVPLQVRGVDHDHRPVGFATNEEVSGNHLLG